MIECKCLTKIIFRTRFPFWKIGCNWQNVFEKKHWSLWLLHYNNVSITTDGTRVSTFLCTQKLRPEEVNVNCSLNTHIFDKTEVLLQVSKWLLPRVCKLSNLLYLHVKAFAISIYSLSVIYTAFVLFTVSHSFWIFLQAYSSRVHSFIWHIL